MNTQFDPKQSRSGHSKSIDAPAGESMSATEARQGRTGFPVLKVLIAGLVLAMIAWGVAEMWGEASDPPAEQTATPPAGDTTPATRNAQPTSDPAEAPAPAPPTGAAPAN